MPSLPTYMPTPEKSFTFWLANFSTLISANPPAFCAFETTTVAVL